MVPPRRYLSIKEAADYLSLSTHTLYKYVSQRRIKYYKFGGAVRFDIRDLDQWVKDQVVMPMPERRRMG